MNKEVISDKQGIALIILFITSNIVMYPTAVEAKKDLWLAIILATVFTMIMVTIYARLLSIFPQKDFFAILQYTFGKFMGKGISILYIWFAFYLASLIFRDYGEFISTVTMTKTPQIIMMIIPSFLCMWVVKEGLEVLGRTANLFAIIISLSILMIAFLLIPDLNINNVRPLLYNGMKPVLRGAFSAFSFPLAEAIVFVMIFTSFENKGSTYKVYILGILIGGLTILLTNRFDLLVVGIDAYSSMYFPGYATVARVDVGNIIQRVEIGGGLIFTVGSFIKLSVCILAITKDIAKIFNYKDYRFIVTPIILLSINFSYIIHDNIMELISWSSEIWPFYAFLFQVILPIIIWIIAEIRKKSLVSS